MNKKILIFYHVYVFDDILAYNILSEQLYAMMMSNLLHTAEKVYINVCSFGNYDIIMRIIDSYNINNKFEIFHTETQTDERSTAQIMKNICDNVDVDYNVLYFHTKGITKINTQQHLQTKYWRHVMEYFNIFKWKDCIEKLEHGFDTCGILWHPNNHYSGTFFWMTSNFIKKIEQNWISYNSQDGRFSVEAIPSKLEHKHYNFYSSDLDLYYNILHPETYIK